MKKTYNIILVCVMLSMAVTSCTGVRKEQETAGSETKDSVMQQTVGEHYGEEVENMWKDYLDAYLRNDGEAVAEFYDEYMVTARQNAQTEKGEQERQNVVSAEFYNLIEAPLEEEYYRNHFKENEEIELEEYDVIKSYLVGMKLRVKEVTKTRYNGVNYFYYIIGRKNGEWKILPWYQNGNGFLRNYIMEAYVDCGDDEVKKYLNIAFMNYTVASICVDGDGSVVVGTEEEIERFNKWLESEYKAYGITDGIYLE